MAEESLTRRGKRSASGTGITALNIENVGTAMCATGAGGNYVLDNGYDMGESVERQAGVDKLEREIEVTPQMLEAGKYALFPNEVLPWYDEEQVLAKIYRAMATTVAHS
jgi:hypothetical protein